MEKEDNSGIKIAIAGIYAEDGSKSHHPFFQNAIGELSGFNLYPFLATYGEYINKQSDETIASAIPTFEKIGKGDDPWYVRMNAINALVSLYTKYQDQVSDLTNALDSESAQSDPSKINAQLANAEKMQEALKAALLNIRKDEENVNLERIIDGALN